MITPNLATRPFLNIRPVWLVTAAAGFFAVILIALNLRLFLIASRTLDSETDNLHELEARQLALSNHLGTDIAALQKIPWRSLEGRIETTNLVLREHAFSWLEMLDDIERVMPYDARLTRITPTFGTEGVTLSVEVIARNRDAMLQFVDNLIADPRFDDPSPTSEQTPEETAVSTYSLELRVTYHPLEEGT